VQWCLSRLAHTGYESLLRRYLSSPPKEPDFTPIVKSAAALDEFQEKARQEERERCAAIVREHGTGHADRTEFLAKEIERGS